MQRPCPACFRERPGSCEWRSRSRRRRPEFQPGPPVAAVHTPAPPTPMTPLPRAFAIRVAHRPLTFQIDDLQKTDPLGPAEKEGRSPIFFTPKPPPPITQSGLSLHLFRFFTPCIISFRANPTSSPSSFRRPPFERCWHLNPPSCSTTETATACFSPEFHLKTCSFTLPFIFYRSVCEPLSPQRRFLGSFASLAQSPSAPPPLSPALVRHRVDNMASTHAQQGSASG